MGICLSDEGLLTTYKKEKKGLTPAPRSQAEIDERENGWQKKSDSFNARIARVSTVTAAEMQEAERAARG